MGTGLPRRHDRAGADASERPGVSLAETLGFLRRPEAYPEQPARVETIETHLSWVFLTDHFAYKLKKPVRLHDADLRKRSARRKNCREEVRLNRRLAPDTYLAVVPLTCSGDSLQLGGPGVAVDWLVKMRRLPEALMLDRLLETRESSEIDIRPAIILLSDLYRRARPESLSFEDYRQRFLRECDASESTLRRAPDALVSAQVCTVLDRLREFVDERAPLLECRLREGRIVEGHGDLRPEHICLTDPPVIFDCLEFQRSLRILDPVRELSYLALECERLGAPVIAQQVLAVYVEQTRDVFADELVCFYKAFSAAVRAKLAAWHLDDPGAKGVEHWLSRMRQYVRYSQDYAAAL